MSTAEHLVAVDQLKPNKIVRGPIFPEPVQVLVTIPMGDAVKLALSRASDLAA